MGGSAYAQVTGGAYPQLEPEWVDEVLLAGAADEVCLHLGEPVSRARAAPARGRAPSRPRRRRAAARRLRRAVPRAVARVHRQSARLVADRRAGVPAGPPAHPVRGGRRAAATAAAGRRDGRALRRRPAAGLRRDHRAACARIPAGPPPPAHAVIQLSSGSTGPSKIIARDAANLVEEVQRYTMIDGVPGGGERIVSLRVDGARARTRRRPALQPARGREPDDPGPDDGGRHPVHRRRWLGSRPRCWASLSTSSCWRRCASRRSCHSSPA